MRVSSYSKVDAVEHRDMVNSGGDTKDRNLRTGVGCTPVVHVICPITSKYLVPVIYDTGTPGDAVASGSSLVLPRGATGRRGQYSALRYTGASIVCYAMQGQQRRDEGTGERAKEVARTVGGTVGQQELG